jgi:hypothetical protein
MLSVYSFLCPFPDFLFSPLLPSPPHRIVTPGASCVLFPRIWVFLHLHRSSLPSHRFAPHELLRHFHFPSFAFASVSLCLLLSRQSHTPLIIPFFPISPSWAPCFSCCHSPLFIIPHIEEPSRMVPLISTPCTVTPSPASLQHFFRTSIALPVYLTHNGHLPTIVIHMCISEPHEVESESVHRVNSNADLASPRSNLSLEADPDPDDVCISLRSAISSSALRKEHSSLGPPSPFRSSLRGIKAAIILEPRMAACRALVVGIYRAALSAKPTGSAPSDLSAFPRRNKIKFPTK